jgi:hypothetical protein
LIYLHFFFLVNPDLNGVTIAIGRKLVSLYPCLTLCPRLTCPFAVAGDERCSLA